MAMTSFTQIVTSTTDNPWQNRASDVAKVGLGLTLSFVCQKYCQRFWWAPRLIQVSSVSLFLSSRESAFHRTAAPIVFGTTLGLLYQDWKPLLGLPGVICDLQEPVAVFVEKCRIDTGELFSEVLVSAILAGFAWWALLCWCTILSSAMTLHATTIGTLALTQLGWKEEGRLAVRDAVCQSIVTAADNLIPFS